MFTFPLVLDGESMADACRRVTIATRSHDPECGCARCADVIAFYLRGYVLTPVGVVSPWGQYV